jgi:hypothetical protein
VLGPALTDTRHFGPALHAHSVSRPCTSATACNTHGPRPLHLGRGGPCDTHAPQPLHFGPQPCTLTYPAPALRPAPCNTHVSRSLHFGPSPAHPRAAVPHFGAGPRNTRGLRPLHTHAPRPRTSAPAPAHSRPPALTRTTPRHTKCDRHPIPKSDVTCHIGGGAQIPPCPRPRRHPPRPTPALPQNPNFAASNARLETKPLHIGCD